MEQMLAEGKIVLGKNGQPRLDGWKVYLDETKPPALQNWWDDIPRIANTSSERLGYPTQKPVALLERIVSASSNPGDVVLDPFCGCGTTIVAAQKLGRRWIGIDVSHLSIALLKYRLQDSFELAEKKDYRVVGEPQDLPSARQLAQEERYQFQFWALSLIKARPLSPDSPSSPPRAGGKRGGVEGKRGADKGIDGRITFFDEPNGKAKSALVQIKSGHVTSAYIRDLRGTLEREGAALGIFITLENPSRDMQAEAAAAGNYHSPGWNQDYPRLQILTIADLLNGQKVQMPPTSVTFKQAEKVKPENGKQSELL
jgi:hypothetical protein